MNYTLATSYAGLLQAIVNPRGVHTFTLARLLGIATSSLDVMARGVRAEEVGLRRAPRDSGSWAIGDTAVLAAFAREKGARNARNHAWAQRNLPLLGPFTALEGWTFEQARALELSAGAEGMAELRAVHALGGGEAVRECMVRRGLAVPTGGAAPFGVLPPLLHALAPTLDPALHLAV